MAYMKILSWNLCGEKGESQKDVTEVQLVLWLRHKARIYLTQVISLTAWANLLSLISSLFKRMVVNSLGCMWCPFCKTLWYNITKVSFENHKSSSQIQSLKCIHVICMVTLDLKVGVWSGVRTQL